MKNPKVSLYWHCKTPDGWRRLPAVLGRNGKVRPRYAQVGDEQILYPTGHYEVRHYENRKVVWRNVGDDAAVALAAQQQQQKALKAGAAAADAGLELVTSPTEGVPLLEKSREYIQRQISRGKLRHAKICTAVLGDFVQMVGVRYAEQLTEAVMLDWYTKLAERGNDKYTIHNKHIAVVGWLKWCGVSTKPLAPDGPPAFTRKKVKIYSPVELQVLFDSLTSPYHSLVLETLLKTGLREKEAATLEWPDLNFEFGTLTVHAKPSNGIKDREERTLPLDSKLAERLQAWHISHPHIRWVLGTPHKDTINGEWLPMLKRLARNAGLNCGVCPPCLSMQQCSRWLLKTFRSTYTTNLLRSGIDPRTVMEYTGHSDLATVMMYLSPAESTETQDKINSIVWTHRGANMVLSDADPR
jgi:integrase